MSKMVHRSYSSKTFENNKWRIVLVWNIERAAYDYVLQVQHETFSDGFNRGSKKWVDKHTSSDKEWAERTAEHYGITIGEDSTNA